MNSKNRRKKWLLFLLFAVLLLGVSGTGTWAAASTNVIAHAKKNRISKGKWIKSQKGTRYRKKNGTYVKKQWCSVGGAVYYFDKDGYVKTGTFRYNKKVYHADSKGRIYVNKWDKSRKKVYYYNSKGNRATGWVRIKGKEYFFTRTGELVTNNWVSSRYVGKNGVKVTGKVVQGRKLNKSGTIQKASQKDKYIFVGASHGVDMSVAVNSSDTIFIAKGGAGLSWLKKTAAPQLMSYLNKNPNYTVIIQLGGNDLENVEKYIQYYKNLMKKYPKTQFYFLENIPGDGEYALTYKNAAKKRYDKKLRAAFGDRCIEAYAYMESTGFRTVDGTHYVLEDIKRVYDHAIRVIKNKNKKQNVRVDKE